VRILEKASFLFLASLALGLVVLTVLVWQGVDVDDEVDRARPAPAPEREPDIAPTQRTAGRSTGQRPLRFELAAVRGDCWMPVRRGSSDGEVLYEGVLASGKSIRFTAQRLWLRLGAASNLELSVNGRSVGDVPSGTV
jgi:Domain of unknown function (DUF4115)